MFEVSKPDDIPVDVSKEIDELDGTVDMSDGLDADEAVRYLEISKIGRTRYENWHEYLGSIRKFRRFVL